MGTYIEYSGTECPCDFTPGASTQTPVHVASQNLQNKTLSFFSYHFLKEQHFNDMCYWHNPSKMDSDLYISC